MRIFFDGISNVCRTKRTYKFICDEIIFYLPQTQFCRKKTVLKLLKTLASFCKMRSFGVPFIGRVSNHRNCSRSSHCPFQHLPK